MTELDFDELDKAVNSIMSGMDTSKRKDGFDDPEDKVLEISSAQTVTAAPALSAQPAPAVAAPSPAEPAPEPAKTSEPLAVKRRGQFMDVIHPSSDMKVTIPPRREGVTLKPSSQFEAAQPPAAEASPEPVPSNTAPVIDAVIAPDVEPATSAQQAEPDAPEKASETAWPDPIDVAEGKNDQRDVDGDGVTDPDPDDIVAVPEDVVEEVAHPATEQPISSPFLADAKVEKRPLGTATPFPESVATPDTPSNPEHAPGEPLPQELASDIMELESSNTGEGAKKPDEQPAQLTGSGSIPQQYTEKPSTNTVANAAIYDTSTHHQPLDGAAKNGSPMKWVIMALVLLIVGALAGAAYFYFKTQ